MEGLSKKFKVIQECDESSNKLVLINHTSKDKEEGYYSEYSLFEYIGFFDGGECFKIGGLEITIDECIDFICEDIEGKNEFITEQDFTNLLEKDDFDDFISLKLKEVCKYVALKKLNEAIESLEDTKDIIWR